MNPFILLNWIAPISVVPFRPRHYGPVDIRWGHFHLVASIGNFPQSVGSFERKGQPLELGVATFALKEFARSLNQSSNQSYQKMRNFFLNPKVVDLEIHRVYDCDWNENNGQ